MKYAGDMELFGKTKQFLIAQNRNFTSEKSGNTGKITIRGATYFYFNKGLDSSIPNLCKMVKRDAKKWIEQHPEAEITDSKSGLRNGLAQQLLHEKMISMQYKN